MRQLQIIYFKACVPCLNLNVCIFSLQIRTHYAFRYFMKISEEFLTYPYNDVHKKNAFKFIVSY